MVFKIYKASDLNKGNFNYISKDFKDLQALKDYQAQKSCGLLLDFFDYEMQNDVEVHYTPSIVLYDEKIK